MPTPFLLLPCTPPPPPPRLPATLPAGWVVLSLPPGQIQLDRPLSIRRSQTVLRGAGRDATTLYITKSLSQVGGGDYWRRRLAGHPFGGRQGNGNNTHIVPNTAADGPGSAVVPSAAQHGRRLHASRWTTSGGWISAPGEHKSEELARVTSSEQRGSYTIKVGRGSGLAGWSRLGWVGWSVGLGVPMAGQDSRCRAGAFSFPACRPASNCSAFQGWTAVGHGLQGSWPPASTLQAVAGSNASRIEAAPFAPAPQVDRTGGLKPGQLVSVMYRESGALAQEIMEGQGRVGSGRIG